MDNRRMNCLNKNKDIVITKELLTRMKACEEDIDWWVRNVGESFVVSDLPKIKGDHNGYVSWLKDKFYHGTYDNKGNQLTHKSSNGYSVERTYDSKGNQLTYKSSNGYSEERTYDNNGIQLTYKNSNGHSWERAYDNNGNQLTHKNSYGHSVEYTYKVSESTLMVTKNGKQVLSIPLKINGVYMRTDSDFSILGV